MGPVRSLTKVGFASCRILRGRGEGGEGTLLTVTDEDQLECRDLLLSHYIVRTWTCRRVVVGGGVKKQVRGKCGVRCENCVCVSDLGNLCVRCGWFACPWPAAAALSLTRSPARSHARHANSHQNSHKFSLLLLLLLAQIVFTQIASLSARSSRTELPLRAPIQSTGTVLYYCVSHVRRRLMMHHIPPIRRKCNKMQKREQSKSAAGERDSDASLFTCPPAQSSSLALHSYSPPPD